MHGNRRVTQLLHGCCRLHLSFFFLHDSQDTGSCRGARFVAGSDESCPALRFIGDADADAGGSGVTCFCFGLSMLDSYVDITEYEDNKRTSYSMMQTKNEVKSRSGFLEPG